MGLYLYRGNSPRTTGSGRVMRRRKFDYKSLRACWNHEMAYYKAWNKRPSSFGTSTSVRKCSRVLELLKSRNASIRAVLTFEAKRSKTTMPAPKMFLPSTPQEFVNRVFGFEKTITGVQAHFVCFSLEIVLVFHLSSHKIAGDFSPPSLV